MRTVLAVAVSALFLVGCSSSPDPVVSETSESTVTPTRSSTSSTKAQPENRTAMHDREAGEGGFIGCNSREDCDVEFAVDSVARIDCAAYGLTEDQQVVRVAIEVSVRDEVNYPDVLNIFNLGSWSALTDDGYTLRSLETTSGCDGQDSSLLMYGINPGEKVRNRVDFILPRSVEKLQLQPAALEGGGWRWRITDQ
ncbi:hypothetical protein QNA14_16835 [Dietzia kunjamensis]|nr:hypothetical protein [Dietzia kunjamensis]